MDETAALLLAALALDALAGDPERLWGRVPHPVVLIGRAVGWLDGLLNGDDDPEERRRWLGAAAIAGLALGAALAGWALHGLADALPFGWVVELLVVAVLLAQRSLLEHVGAVVTAFAAGGLAEARRAVSRIVGRDPEALDEPGVCRAAVESLAENLSDGVVAPAFWYLLLGLPGLLACKAVNTADSMIAHRTPRHAAFGWATAKLDTALNFVPARLTAALVALAARFQSGADGTAAWAAATRDGPRHRSVNAGWPEAAVAGALGLRLAGPRAYHGEVVEDAWMGDGRAELAPADVRDAMTLVRGALAWLWVAVAALAALAWLD